MTPLSRSSLPTSVELQPVNRTSPSEADTRASEKSELSQDTEHRLRRSVDDGRTKLRQSPTFAQARRKPPYCLSLPRSGKIAADRRRLRGRASARSSTSYSSVLPAPTFWAIAYKQFSLTIGVYMCAMGVGSFLTRYVEGRHELEAFVRAEILIGATGRTFRAPALLPLPATRPILQYQWTMLLLVFGIGYAHRCGDPPAGPGDEGLLPPAR